MIAAQKRLALAALALVLAIQGGVGATAVHANPREHLNVPLPARSRAAGEAHLFWSSRGFRQTVTFYERFLARTGLGHEAVPVFRYRGTDVARFLARQAGTSWAAIHVFRHGGRTMIYIVPRDLLTPEPTRDRR